MKTLLCVAAIIAASLSADGRTRPVVQASEPPGPAISIAQKDAQPNRAPVEVGMVPTRADGGSAVRMLLRGRTMSIPWGYFLFGKPDLLNEPDVIVLRAFLPEFTPKPTMSPPLDGGHGDEVSFSLNKRLGSLTSLFASYAADRIDSFPFTDAHGLRMFRVSQRRVPGRIDESVVYFAHRDEAVTVLIHCEPAHRSPPCTHRFVADDLAFELRYHMLYLPQWQKIQAGVTELVRSFERR